MIPQSVMPILSNQFIDARKRFTSWIRSSCGMSWILSFTIHGIILIGLSLVILKSIESLNPLSLVATVEEQLDMNPEFLDDEIPLKLTTQDTLPLPTVQPPLVNVIGNMTDLALSSAAMEMSRSIKQVSSEMDRFAKNLASSTGSYSELPTVLSPAQLRAAVKQGGLQGSPTAGDAMDTILADIQKHVEQQPVLVIWMVDASLSLMEDRLRMAERIERFLHSGANGSIQNNSLQNGVVAFGQTVQEIVRPTVNGPKVADAIRSIYVDQSGVENVFIAVQWAVRKYGKRRDRKILLVLWTDESGDDTSLLEETIALCQKWHISVTTIGPTSVLGMQRGYQPFTLTSNEGEQYKLLLPVNRGPDTAFPERIMLPYWHDEKLPPWNFDGARMANRSVWYGGPFREGLLSGVGPYSLTRLSLATRGKFLILNRPGEKTQFPVEKLQDYFPEYSSREDCLRTIQKSRLRAAIVAAVDDTYAASAQMYPILAFVAARTTSYPFNVWTPYLTPVEFRMQLKRLLQSQVRLAISSSYVVERALSRFTADGLEYEYRQESSKRWRAWYDVTLGRLLANSVRLTEYRLICEALLRGEILHTKTNYIDLLPSHRFRGGQSSELRAMEAERLLWRCVEENSKTPWQYLAEWELKHGFGLEAVQKQRERPKPTSGRKERNQTFSIPRL
jgi:hypothetical protein